MRKGVARPKPIISIMGDRFMLPSMFEKAIREKCGDAAEIRSYEMPWPDEPMEHGYAEPGMEGLKEYQGTADEVVAHMDGAEIAVTHLAPFSAGVIERLPELKLIAVSRGGPVNIDMAAARERKIRVVNTPGRNASAVADSPSAQFWPRHGSSPKVMQACVAGNGAAIFIAPTLPARNCRK